MICLDRTNYPVAIPLQDSARPDMEVTLMARRNTKNTENTATEEAPVSTEATETPATESEETIDLTAFNEAVAQAVAEKDPDTGEVPLAQLDAVKTAYRALDGAKPKNAAKKVVNEAMKENMNEGTFPEARAYLQISEEALVAGGGGGGEKAPADPTEAFVQRVATLQLAYHLATSNVPEGVSDGWQDKVNELVSSTNDQATNLLAYLHNDSEDKGDEPEASAVAKNAVKLAEGKSARAGSTRSGSTYTGERRDIGKHIENAFANVEEGTFLKIAEIRSTKSPEYGDELPSAGAISARLFPQSGKSTMVKVGIHPETRDGKKGAVKDSSRTE